MKLQAKTQTEYKDNYIAEDVFVRTIPKDVTTSNEYTWHRDTSDRSVEVIESNGWKLQFDNELPRLLCEGDLIYIKKKHFHRIIKGEGDLVIKITENDTF